MELNQAKLKEITNASNTSVAVMLSLALRQRSARKGLTNVNTTKDQLVRAGEQIVDEDYTKFWQALEAAGIGQYIVGRRGNPDRFKWHYSLREIAKVAVEGKDSEVKALASKLPAVASRKPRAAKKAPASKKRQRLSSEAKEIERRIMQTVRQALASNM